MQHLPSLLSGLRPSLHILSINLSVAASSHSQTALIEYGLQLFSWLSLYPLVWEYL